MSAAPETSTTAADDLETAADQAIAASGGDVREAIKALIVANNFLEAWVAKLQASSRQGTHGDDWIRRAIRRSADVGSDLLRCSALRRGRHRTRRGGGMLQPER